MSILGFLFKSKKEMAKENTKHVKVGKYTLTPHAQNRIVDKTRKMDKIDVLDNLFTKPNGITKTNINSKNQPSYNRIGKRITTTINPKNDKVVTCRPVSDKEIRDFKLVNISKKDEKRNMLSEIQKNKFTTRAKEEAKNLLLESKIEKFLSDDDSDRFIDILDFEVASLVNAQEDGESIDEELLKIYDLLTDIVLDNEEDLDFLNQLFFN
jgi:hypothetical protein